VGFVRLSRFYELRQLFLHNKYPATSTQFEIQIYKIKHVIFRIKVFFNFTHRLNWKELGPIMPNIRQNLMYLFTYLRRLAVKRRGGVDVVTLVFSDKIDHDTLEVLMLLLWYSATKLTMTL